MKRIVIAPDKFKGSLTSFEVCNAIEEGLLQASSSFQITKLPMADGGDGLSEVIRYYTHAQKQTAVVHNPLGEQVEAEWLLSADKKTAFIEMAKASGLQLLKPEQYNPILTSTYGTGELIKAAIESGVQKIILGIGGSATNDCGIGMAAALGYRFFNAQGTAVKPIGGNLIHIEHIEVTNPFFDKRNFSVACDVKNPLCGENGATKVYAPQKGATPEMIELLESGMLHFAAVLKRELGADVLRLEGGGAAGGLGAGCVAFLGAGLVSGIDLVMHLSRMEDHLGNADLVITGEGKIDEQTLQGKVVSGVALLAKKQRKPVVALCGSLALKDDEWNQHGIEAVFSIINRPITVEEAIKNAAPLLKSLASQVGQLLLL